MAFNWKSLFIVDEEAEKAAKLEKLNEPAPAPTAPSSGQKFPQQVPTSSKTLTQGDAFNEVLAVYEKGFEGLNQEGYDFFELYKAVQTVGADNPQAYQMAFAMGKSIKSDLSKAILIDKGNHYLAEIEKVHAQYAAVGNQKKAALANQLNTEKSHLNSSIKNLESHIAQLQSELAKYKTELTQIDQKYTAPLAEMEAKIGANDGAKQTISQSIQKVLNGINQNL